MSRDDSGARRLALNPERSFAVSAPAGSGKTELLIRRFLVLLARVERPENILAITFTRKAAAEMQTRILTALREAAEEMVPRSEHHAETLELARAALLHSRDCGWQLEQSAGRLQVKTIDSFCHQIASALPLRSGHGPTTTLLDRPEPLYRQATRNLVELAAADDTVGAALRTVLRFYDNDLDALAALLAELLANRLLWLPELGGGAPHRGQLEARLQLLVEEELEGTARMSALWSDLRELLAYAADHLEGPVVEALRAAAHSASPPAPQIANLGVWQAISQLLLIGDGSVRKKVDRRTGFPTAKESHHPDRAKEFKERMETLLAELAERSELVETLVAVRELPVPTYSGAEWPVIEALGTLLPRLAASLDFELRATASSDFPGVALAALTALRDGEGPTRLALRLDYRIEHILVDEFQDTSSQQVELLQRLTESWQPGDLRSLFIVGDGMQSIYGFRKANVGLFIRARQSGIGSVELTPIDLTANFRSRGNLIDWFNTHFPALFPAEDDLGHGQVRYRESTATREMSDESPVTLLASSSDDQEAAQIASQVAELLRRHPEQQIGILVRARSHLAKVLPALRQRGLRWQGSDIEPLGDRLWVSDIHALTCLLHAPADRMAWLIALRAPYAGLDPYDLHALCSEGKADPHSPPCIDFEVRNRARIRSLSSAGEAILDRLDGALTAARRDLGTLPLRTLVERTWRQVGGPQTLGSQACVADIDAYLELLERHDQGGMIENWETFREEFAGLYAQPDPSGDARLQVMTIHKAKGLEFDTVILPRLNAKPRTEDAPLLLWWEREFSDGETHFLFSNKGSRSEPAPIYDYLKSEESARRREENVRLLYVACTRARERLLLSAIVKPGKSADELEKPAANSLLEVLWPQLQGAFQQAAQGLVFPEQEATPPALFGRSIRRLAPNWKPEPDTAINPLPAGEATLSRVDAVYAARARRLGTMLHQSLQRTASAPLNDPESRLEAERRLWTRLAGEPESTAEELTRQLRTVIADPVGNWLLDPTHECSATELSLDYLDRDGQLRTAVIDRSFRFGGCLWIVDYKSARPAGGESLDAFLLRQSELHAGQLRHYRQLMEDDAPAIRTLLYFSALPHCIEIDAAGEPKPFLLPGNAHRTTH